MKTALITTTIHIPHVLKLLRKYDPGVRFFVAGDVRSPPDTAEFVQSLKNADFISYDDQKKLKYKCSEIIGWNCIQRRAIALLEALQWGAEVIITWDDDNLPLSRSYFNAFTGPFARPFNGLQVSAWNGWANQYGAGFKHRGFPIDKALVGHKASTIVDAKVGVVAGICLGDPDIDAYMRMALHPSIDAVGETVRSGCVVSLDSKCVFNTQNTAYLRQFAPAMFCAPGLGRHDDIIASLLTQRVMKTQGYQVHIGPPFAYQERNHHDLLIDLKHEMWGMEHLLEISEWIDKIPDGDVMRMCRHYWEHCTILPEQSREAGLAFLEDVEAVMK